MPAEPESVNESPDGRAMDSSFTGTQRLVATERYNDRFISVFKHLLCFLLPLATFFFLVAGLITGKPHTVPGILAFTLPFWLILLIEWVYPNEKKPARNDYSSWFFDGILLMLALLQFVNVVLMLNYIVLLHWETGHNVVIGLANLVGIRFLVGTSSGISGIVVAHELIHRRAVLWQWLGRLLLCTVCYEHFLVSHKRGHHLNIGMPDDIATAKAGESFKVYWRRISLGYFSYAWRSERERLEPSSPLVQLINNSVFQGLLIESAMVLLIIYRYGWLAAFMFLYQALAAVRILEAVNYFQHWGLENGRFGNSYGWVTPSWISRYALIGLSHHIGHHLDENARFYEIPFSKQGPQLPYGYFVMNLWVKLNNESYRKMAVRELHIYQRTDVKPAWL